MVIIKRAGLLGIFLSFAACDSEPYRTPIRLTPHGESVRANMAAQIIDPAPPASSATTSDGKRIVLGIEAYQTGEVKDPTEQSTAPSTTLIEEVN